MDIHQNLSKIDEDGLLYELYYDIDYGLEEIISLGSYPRISLDENFRNHILKEPDFPLPENIYLHPAGCSAFSTTDTKGTTLMGRNYDWDYVDSINLILHTNPKNGYASVGMCDLGFLGIEKNGNFDNTKYQWMLYSPYYTLDGINEKGLACTILLLDEDAMIQDTGKPVISSSTVVRLLLDRAKTVKEAEEILRKYDVCSAMYIDKSIDPNGGKSFHWLVTDATGDSAVFEYVNNELIVNRTPIIVTPDITTLTEAKSYRDINSSVNIKYPKKNEGYLAVTNFYVSEGAKNTVCEGYWRYQKLCEKLNGTHHSVEEAMAILKDIKYYNNDYDTYLAIKGAEKNPDNTSIWKWLSMWSIVYDTKNLTMNICHRENYDIMRTINIR